MNNRPNILNSDDTEHLKYLQDIIKRMADNSFKIKGWSITITGGLLALLISNNNASVKDLLVVYVPIFGFWLIDAYYLMLEKSFRDRYENDVKKIKDKNYSEVKYFSFGKIHEKKKSKEWFNKIRLKNSFEKFVNYVKTLFSISILLTYIPMCSSIILIMHILKS